MGPQMTYKELDKELKHYKRRWKRKWFRADYMAYWKRTQFGIELRAGWRCTSPSYGKGERVLLLYPDGRVTISCHVSMPYERYRLNHYFPFNKKWHFWWWRNGLFISRIKEGQTSWNTIGDPTAVLLAPRYYAYKDKKGNHLVRARYITFDKDGEPVEPLKGQRYKTYKRHLIKEDNQRNQPRKRGWYWTRRARNIFRNNTKCKAEDPKNRELPWNKQVSCSSMGGRWERQPPQSWDCGCVTYRKAYKRGFSKKVKEILDEPNATVRAAWMQIYGIQKFFQDAGSTTVDTNKQYKLLRMETGGGDRDTATLVALKMTCPSTGTVYINSVPNNITSVSQALDWMYDYRGYLANVGQQT